MTDSKVSSVTCFEGTHTHTHRHHVCVCVCVRQCFSTETYYNTILPGQALSAAWDQSRLWHSPHSATLLSYLTTCTEHYELQAPTSNRKHPLFCSLQQFQVLACMLGITISKHHSSNTVHKDNLPSVYGHIK